TVYAVIIVVVVGIALAVLTNKPPAHGIFNAAQSPSIPQTPWKPSAEHDAASNADFSVETDRNDNVRWAGTSVGKDWPQFNGTHRDNRSTETGLLPAWPPEGLRLAWVALGLGNGLSSVAVVDGVAYTAGNKGESEAIVALDAGTGEKIWSTPFA